jgi:hypothetical protein
MKNQAMKFQPYHRTSGADAALVTKKRVTSCLFGLLLVGLAVPGFGQIEPARPTVRPIPGAPKRSYVPASFSAQPGLQCKIHSAGGVPSTAITVFTDDDGYARFHAVRTTANDPAHSLTADCWNSAGKSFSYSVDLSAEDTFTPRPLDLAKERGTDRPALKGDPLSYTQAELIQGNYGLRPDPKDTDAYARWLAAATNPGRMLEAKRPRPFHTEKRKLSAQRPASDSETDATAQLKAPGAKNTINQTTWPWWVGSALLGAPTYVANEATFNVPTAIPSGDETWGTAISIWNGVEGSSPALIQGGVDIQTNYTTAAYNTWREYCCGAADSNGYGGAFTPNPGDSIYSQEWYCDSQGNPNPNGGYGCTYLYDYTTSATLSCVSANGSPCWSVKAPSSWTSFGTDADFVIEDQTPQLLDGWSQTTAYTPGQVVDYDANPYICLQANKNQTPSNHTASWAPYPIYDAFTDFAPEVTMNGSAYSTTTGGYTQMVSNDPLVNQLVDFTNTVSHINVSLAPLGQTIFTSSQFKEVGGLASNSGAAESIGVGPSAFGSDTGVAWTLGYNANSSGNYNIYQWQNSGWVQQPGSATHIAVSPDGYPWVINNQGNVYYWNGSAFELAPGNACASWISVGRNAYGSAHGDPWILGCHEGTNGFNIYQLQGSTWVQQTGQATRLAMGFDGPWIINPAGSVYFWNDGGFVEAPGTPCATDIAASPTAIPAPGTLYTYGDVWITGCHFQSTGYNIYQLQNATWAQVPGQAVHISLSPDWGVPWVVDSNGHIYE